MKMKSVVKKKFQEVVNRNKEGFTTIELIIVIVIVGILSAIAIPKISSISDVDLYATARQVKSDIRFAQQLAMSKFMKTTITFAGGSDTYTISDSGGVAIGNGNKFLPPNSRATFGANYSYQFNSTGAPTDIGGLGWTVVISSGGQSEQVVVSNVTGRATIP